MSLSFRCCVLNLFLQVDRALVVYQSPALIIAMRTDVTDEDGRTSMDGRTGICTSSAM